MSTITPNMNLIESTINVDSGLLWEQNLNASLTIIDGHNHAPGYGVQITPQGLNINANLPMNNNQLTGIQALVLSPQISLATLRAIYSIGADLYYNDANGNVIQITSGGTVNATSSGISSGSATASFVSSVLVVNAASNTPANIQGGSLLLGNNVAASKFLTLAPPNSMAANYSLTLPALPVATSFMQLDTSGNMTASVAVANGITRSNLAAVGQQVSSSSGTFVTTSSSMVDITNLTVTITTTGRPVMLIVQPDGSSSFNTFGVGNSTNNSITLGGIQVVKDGTFISRYSLVVTPSASGGIAAQMVFPVMYLDTAGGGAGTYTYKIQGQVSPPGQLNAFHCVLVAYEL